MSPRLPRVTAGQILHPKILQSILRDADLSPDTLRDFLK